jgi:hypothetical protein
LQSQVTAALIAAVAALVVATISLITALLNQRASRRMNQELERFKDELAQARERRARASQALHSGIRGIQKLKDAIQLVLEAAPGSLDGKRVVELLQHCRIEMSSSYEDSVSALDQVEAENYHQVKNIALTLEMSCRTELMALSDVAHLQADIVGRLRDARRRLSEKQQLLRDSLIQRAL